MKEDELRQRLHKFTAPEASQSARARARHRSLIAFQQADSRPLEAPERKGLILNWRRAIALVLIAGILLLFFVRHHPSPENLANDRQILQQMGKLFPNQVNAVVEENGKVDLSIAQSPVVGSDQPVLVVFKQGRNTIRVLSYSGHRVCLMLGTTESCVEILATPSGGVILEAKDKVWLASEHPVVAGYSVRAQTLEASL